MKNRRTRSSVAVCVLLLLASAGLAQQKPSYKELPNFRKVNDELVLGGQPLSGGAKKLAELGIRTILNLRGEQDERIDVEKKESESAGLRYFNIALPGLSAPSDEQVARVMSIVNNPDNQPVFVHCRRGSDRTGTIGAIYRIAHDGWTADRAIAEAKSFGMSWAEFGMRGYIWDYYKQQLRTRNQPTTATNH